MIVCLALIGIFSSSETAYAKKITSTRQAEEKALNQVKKAVVTESDKDSKKGEKWKDNKSCQKI